MPTAHAGAQPGPPQKPSSKAIIIRGLQDEMEAKRREWEALHTENVALRTREAVLLQQVTQQGDNLHFVALAAAQAPSSDAPDMAKTLMLDLEVFELMERIGRPSSSTGGGTGGGTGTGSSSSSSEEPFTTQRLRAAVTPERVAAMRASSVEQVAAHLKQLTMRMLMLLAGGPSKASFFSDSLESVVNEYGEYGLLLHVAADRIALQLGTINLDTLQMQEPPPGFWETVVQNLELRDEQVQLLATGFRNYQQKSKPIINSLHGTVCSIRAILDADETLDSSMQGGQQQQQQSQPSSSRLAGQPFWQFLHNTLTTSVGVDGAAPAGGGGGSTPAAAAMQQPVDGGSNYSLPVLSVPAAAGSAQHSGGSSGSGSGGSSNNTGGKPSLGGSKGFTLQPGTAVKPWQEFGLSHGCLSAGTAEELEQLMDELMQQTMKLREMHRTVTYLFLNTLDARQHALFITGSWPWWSRPLTMCQYIAEQSGQRLCSPGVSHRSSDGQPASAAAVADGVLSLSLSPLQQKQQQ